jgi:hypothetical protein
MRDVREAEVVEGVAQPPERQQRRTLGSRLHLLLRRWLCRRTWRASVEEDFPSAVKLSNPRGSKRGDLRSRLIENRTTGESEIAGSIYYYAIWLPAERCDSWFEEFRPNRDHLLLPVHNVAPSEKLSVVSEVREKLLRIALREGFGKRDLGRTNFVSSIRSVSGESQEKEEQPNVMSHIFGTGWNSAYSARQSREPLLFLHRTAGIAPDPRYRGCGKIACPASCATWPPNNGVLLTTIVVMSSPRYRRGSVG